ncbi:MAG: response regulator, partial [Bacteroidota bacterium]
RESIKNVKIVMASSEPIQSAGDENIEDIIDATITKPVKYEKLKNIIARLLQPVQDDEGSKLSQIRNTDVNEKLDLNVLIADDNNINIKVGKVILEKFVTNIDAVENGQEAIDLSMEKKYDIIFMDIQMPVMDGVGATMAIRNNSENPSTEAIIIALTANISKTDIEMYLQNGMDDFLNKPYKPNQIKALLDKYFPS